MDLSKIDVFAEIAVRASCDQATKEAPVLTWHFSHRLSSPHLLFVLSNYPLHENVHLGRRSLRAHPLLPVSNESHVEHDRWRRRRFPGRLGEWPHWRADMRRSRRSRP
jgi:hypothetical protein